MSEVGTGRSRGRALMLAVGALVSVAAVVVALSFVLSGAASDRARQQASDRAAAVADAAALVPWKDYPQGYRQVLEVGSCEQLAQAFMATQDQAESVMLRVHSHDNESLRRYIVKLGASKGCEIIGLTVLHPPFSADS